MEHVACVHLTPNIHSRNINVLNNKLNVHKFVGNVSWAPGIGGVFPTHSLHALRTASLQLTALTLGQLDVKLTQSFYDFGSLIYITTMSIYD